MNQEKTVGQQAKELGEEVFTVFQMRNMGVSVEVGQAIAIPGRDYRYIVTEDVLSQAFALWKEGDRQTRERVKARMSRIR
jgi:hypothetical protein